MPDGGPANPSNWAQGSRLADIMDALKILEEEPPPLPPPSGAERSTGMLTVSTHNCIVSHSCTHAHTHTFPTLHHPCPCHGVDQAPLSVSNLQSLHHQTNIAAGSEGSTTAAEGLLSDSKIRCAFFSMVNVRRNIQYRIVVGCGWFISYWRFEGSTHSLTHSPTCHSTWECGVVWHMP